MLKRVFTADTINKIANHPSVIGGAKLEQFGGNADFTEIINNPDNIALCYDGGCFLLIKDDNAYEIHTMALKSGRGLAVRNAVEEMLDYAFHFIGCHKLTSMTYKTNAAASKLAEQYMTKVREDSQMNYYSLTNLEWANARRAA